MAEESYDAGKFVNRTKEQESFEALIGAKTRSHVPVLCFYGVGGVGKSWLQAHLQDSLGKRNDRQQASPIPFVRMDFGGVARPATFLEFLYRIAWELDKHGAKCPEFWASWNCYHADAPHPTPESKDKPEPPRYTSVLQVFLSMLYSLSIISWLTKYSPVELIAIIGAGSGMVYYLTGELVKILDKWKLLKTGYHRKYQNKKWEELEKLLPQALENDLERSSRSTQTFHCSSVLFFDTLENVDPLTDETPDIQKWIADFAQRYKHSLVVLTGHNRVHWGTLPASKNWNWKDEKHFDGTVPVEAWDARHPWRDVHLLQYRLLDLEEKDAKELLRRYEITDAALCEVILRECREEVRRNQSGEQIIREGYHAASLFLCVETLKLMRGEGDSWPSAQRFALDRDKHETIIGRYLKSLPPEEWIRTKKLAFTPQFDLEAATAICQVPVDSLAWINRRNYVSEITPGLPGKWFIFNSNMRRHILAAAPPTSSNEVHSFDALDFNAQALHAIWFKHWNERHKGTKKVFLKRIDPFHLFAQLAWYHLWNIEPKRAWEQWKKLAAGAKENPKLYLILLRWWDMTDVRHRKPHNEIEADIVLELAKEYWEVPLDNPLDQFRPAIECCERALEFFTKEDHAEKWARAQHRKGAGIGGIGRFVSLKDAERLEYLREALVCYELALEVRKKDKHPKDWNVTQDNKGIAHCDIGQLVSLKDVERLIHLKQAVDFFEEVLTIAEAQDKEQWSKTQTNKGQTLCEAGRLASLEDAERLRYLREALSCYEMALKVSTKDKYPKDWADIQYNKGFSCDEIGRLASLEDAERLKYLREALSCYELALKIYTKDKYPKDWAITQFNKALTEWRLGDSFSALISMGHAVEVYRLINDKHKMKEAQEAVSAIQRGVRLS